MSTRKNKKTKIIARVPKNPKMPFTIPRSVTEIIELFIKYNFRPLTYNIIADLLRKNTNAIVQRIKRYPKYFEITGKRPYNISLRKGLNFVIFYRDNFHCQICNKKYEMKHLIIRFKDPNLDDKYDWNNCITSCKNCKDVKITKYKSAKARKDEKPRITWEYKEIRITKVSDFKFSENRFAGIEDRSYFEYDELNGKGPFHLIDDDDEISSYKITDILDYFGDDGWELVNMSEIEYNPYGFFPYSTITSYPSGSGEEYFCIFKRKKEED